ncbi:CDP-alcohol phosphatidyltransferase family protein [Saccharopolyspora gloriosae]|uniref:Phosphatidylinositol phosphate synthase n=1 Tax=Saccharopolyspora gloriosae TaxID=455344 RepID=A0A840NDU7_9PSEU|nr:CDP-alcohol phosphatidyltransferase family protein [Saccharopolyspora gloriosae]MBB5068398.1 CDP-diacylglycerol--glycerol-3-phosphate 3-phosphatidyltransferase [Saccharopolyspora gloriosae]
MLNIFARASISRWTHPLGAALVRVGLTPNMVTIIGTVASVASALWFFPRGELFVGTVVVTVFLLFDVLDGAMARAGGTSSEFGGVLDASCDRIADGALFGSLVWWALVVADDRALGVGLLICLVGAQVTSYVKARAEANGLSADGGLAERAERFVLVLVGTGLHGLGLPYVLDVAVWVLAVLSAFTVVQRLRAAAVQAGTSST